MEQKLRCGIHTCSLMPLDVDKHRCAGHNQRSRIFLFWFGMQAHRVISESVSLNQLFQLQGLVVGRKSCGPARGRPFTLLVSLLFRSLRPGLLMFRSRTAGGRGPDHCRHVGGGIGAVAQAGPARVGADWRGPPGNEYYVE